MNLKKENKIQEAIELKIQKCLLDFLNENHIPIEDANKCILTNLQRKNFIAYFVLEYNKNILGSIEVYYANKQIVVEKVEFKSK